MNAKEEFERIKKVYEETNNISLEDIGTLINIVDILEKKSKQGAKTIKRLLNAQYGYQTSDSISKVQLSSLYGIHKERHKNVDIYIIIKKDTNTGASDIYFKNVTVEIKDKFIQVYNGTKYFNYNINEVVFYELRVSIDREYIENDNKILQDYVNNESEVK